MGNLEDLMLFYNQNLKSKIGRSDVHQTVAHQPGVPFWGQSTVWWFSKTIFSFI